MIAAEITNTPGDFSNLDPMITTALRELERAGVTERPQVALADAGYWNEQHFDEVIANKHIQVLIPPDRGRPQRTPARVDRRALRMDASRAGLRARQTALPQTDPDDRARVRAHQTQPADHPIPPKRQDRGADRMAAADGNPQPHQAPPPPTRRRRRPEPGGRDRLPPIIDGRSKSDYGRADQSLGIEEEFRDSLATRRSRAPVAGRDAFAADPIIRRPRECAIT